MKTTLSLVTIALLLLACNGDTGVSPVPHYDAGTLAMKYEIVYALVQDLSCTESSVCSSIGIGSKPCGGPWRYLVYSTATVDVEELSRAVADLNEYEAGFNTQEHRMSDCSVAQAVQPGCVEQKCVDLNTAP